MPGRKRETVDETLARLKSLRATLESNKNDAASLETLTKALSSSVNLVVARAADIAREVKVESLAKPLAEAFERFLEARPDADKGCAAKFALASALAELSADVPELFLRGIRVEQREPVWGGSQDVAAGLRGACAAGLVNCGYRHALTELADLLMDPEPAARLGAARGISAWGREEGAPLLRVKALAGDPSTEVLGECLLGVIALRSHGAVRFVAKFLDHRDPAVAESAALALGESRQSDALDVLRDAYARSAHGGDPELRRVLLLCIAITRLPQAIRFLLDELGNAELTIAKHALSALAVYKHDAALAKQVGEKVDARRSRALTEAFTAQFGG